MSRSAVEISTATREHAAQLAPRLRAADLAEIAAGTGRPPIEVIRTGIADSVRAWAVFIDGSIAAVFGVGRIDRETGAPWLLGTEAIDRNPMAFVRVSAHYILTMRAMFPVLRNVVHAENVKAVRWLRRAGFTIHPAVPYGSGMFHPFEMR